MIELCYEYLSVRCILLYVLVMSRTRFRVNPHSIVVWMSRNSLLEAGTKSEVSVTATGIEPKTRVTFTLCGFTLKRVRDMTRTCSQFLSRLPRIKAISIHFIKKSFPRVKLSTACSKWKSSCKKIRILCFTIFYMLNEEMLSSEA